MCAQQDVEPSVHWAYATHFGTGWYEINDESSAFILRMAPRRTFGEAAIDEHGTRQIAWTVRVPLTVGVAQLDLGDIPGIVDPDNLTTVSAAVGADADIPLTERFSVRPYAEAGYGTVVNDGDSAWTYKAGIRSRYTLPHPELDRSLLAGLAVVGYEPKTGLPDDFTFAWVGAEIGHPVGRPDPGDGQALVYWHLTYTEFLDEARFDTRDGQTDSVTNYWQIGAAIGKRDESLRLGFLRFDRLGLAFDFSPSGESRGVKVIVRSLYDL